MLNTDFHRIIWSSAKVEDDCLRRWSRFSGKHSQIHIISSTPAEAAKDKSMKITKYMSWSKCISCGTQKNGGNKEQTNYVTWKIRTIKSKCISCGTTKWWYFHSKSLPIVVPLGLSAMWSGLARCCWSLVWGSNWNLDILHRTMSLCSGVTEPWLEASSWYSWDHNKPHI